MTTRRALTLAGRVVVVAGADTPSGAALALSAAGDGAAVVVCGDDERALGEVAADLRALGARVATFTGDVTDGGGRAALAEMIDELFGGAAL